MIWNVLIPAAASVIGGAMASRSASRAADAAAEGQQRSLDFQREVYSNTRRDQAPYIKAGQSALSAMMSMVGLPTGGASAPATRPYYDADPTDYAMGRRGGTLGGNYGVGPAPTRRTQYRAMGGPVRAGERYVVGENRPETLMTAGGNTTIGAYGPQTIVPKQDGYIAPTAPENPGGNAGEYNFMTDPGYEFRFKEGIRAHDLSASSTGTLYGTGAERRLTRYGQDYASNEYNNVFNRLGVISGLGTSARSVSATAGGYASQSVGSAYTAQGDARASGYANRGNIVSDTLGDLGSLDWDSIFDRKTPAATGTPYYGVPYANQPPYSGP